MSSGKIGAVSGSAAAYGVSQNQSAPAARQSGAKASVSSSAPVVPVQPVTPVKEVTTRELSLADVSDTVAQVRDYVREVVPELDFSIDDDTDKIVIKLMDMSTHEVLRQIPSEEIIHIAKMLDKLQGLLYRGKA